MVKQLSQPCAHKNLQVLRVPHQNANIWGSAESSSKYTTVSVRNRSGKFEGKVTEGKEGFVTGLSL